ncbi:hypothetical protein LLR08_11790 [Rouxiella badensis]|uniref:hypothetical protein n=1 Tax=Rouxiella badensis TaxID=1646377 RepID=UPI001D14361D|nr:hypothetical protein [Rouxiella badensis]MCC3703233.1 hypothetical protein [Rouxiella badensis]
MSGIEDSNQGAGWNDHDTPYGTIHSYDGNSSSSYGGTSGGNSGHTGVTDKTKINIATTKTYSGVFMSMCVNNLKNHEGFKNTMYKDQAGNSRHGIQLGYPCAG